jgi:hypothetical protein
LLLALAAERQDIGRTRAIRCRWSHRSHRGATPTPLLSKPGLAEPLNSSHYVLRHGPGSVLFGTFFLLLAGVVLLIVNVQGWRADTWIALLLATIFGAYGLLVLAEVVVTRIEVSPDGIVCSSPWRKTRRVPWSQITNSNFSAVNYWYVFSTRSFGKVRVSLFLRNATRLVADAHRLGSMTVREP